MNDEEVNEAISEVLNFNKNRTEDDVIITEPITEENNSYEENPLEKLYEYELNDLFKNVYVHPYSGDIIRPLSKKEVLFKNKHFPSLAKLAKESIRTSLIDKAKKCYISNSKGKQEEGSINNYKGIQEKTDELLKLPDKEMIETILYILTGSSEGTLECYRLPPEIVMECIIRSLNKVLANKRKIFCNLEFFHLYASIHLCLYINNNDQYEALENAYNYSSKIINIIENVISTSSFNSLENKAFIGRCYILNGRILKTAENYNEAIQCYKKALVLFDDIIKLPCCWKGHDKYYFLRQNKKYSLDNIWLVCRCLEDLGICVYILGERPLVAQSYFKSSFNIINKFWE
eukprot:jgi/Orpsp1_1/1175710/evm.model.c7180000054917.1